MKIYISGKITGLPFSEVEAKFQQAEWLLEDLGFEALSPLKNGLTKDQTWAEHMVRDIEILFQCKTILMLDNWVDSKGARIEKNIADELSMNILFETNIISNQGIAVKIKNAIHEATGKRFEEYTTKSRRRDAVFARMIFVHHCRGNKMKLMDIAQYIHRNHTSIIYYIKKYNDEVKYNPYFRDLAKRIEEKLNPKTVENAKS